MLAVACALVQSSSLIGESKSHQEEVGNQLLLHDALTLAASLSVQSLFDFRAVRDGTEASRRGRARFARPEDGDPFTAKAAFEAWIQACSNHHKHIS